MSNPLDSMAISEAGLRLIENFEGFSSVQYNDGTGVMTIGYGTTEADIRPLPRFVTRQQAEDLLRQKLANRYEPAVRSLNVPLNQNQFDALCSLCYNCGPGFVEWQIGRDLRARNYRAAALDFLRYVRAATTGQVLQGLVNRRNAERALFETPFQAPKPTDPYGIYPAEAIHVGSLKLSEKDVVAEYDHLRKRPILNRRKLRTSQAQCALLAHRVARVALLSHPASWGVHNRGRRFQGLIKRAQGQQLVK